MRLQTEDVLTIDREDSYRMFRTRIRAANPLLPVSHAAARIDARDAREIGTRCVATLDHAQRLARDSSLEAFLGVGEG